MEKAFWLGLWLGLGLCPNKCTLHAIDTITFLEGFENEMEKRYGIQGSMKFFILTSHTYILLFLDAQTNAHFMQLTP